MKFCEHLAPLYQNEMRHGNRPLFVSMPKNAAAILYVHMKNKLLNYEVDGIQSGTVIDYHFPKEKYYCCDVCKHYISGPMEEDQKERFEHSQFDVPNDKIVATMDNVYVEEGFCAKFTVPTERKDSRNG